MCPRPPCWKRCWEAEVPSVYSPGGADGSVTAYNSPMRLFLQQRPDGREAPRFVQLQLEADLIGGWTLTRETGQVGGRSTLKREQYLDQSTALAALERARDQTLKKGFQLMFAQGEAI